MNEATNPKNEEKIINRFIYLSNIIGKYAHRWKYQSPRLRGWVNEYNNLRSDHFDIFEKYCERLGYCKDHDGYDSLA